MPIFSNRSIARMLEDITPVIGKTRAHDHERRLEKGGEGALAAEWEIAAIYCLAQEGTIRAKKVRHKVGELDLIYSSRKIPGQVAIEVTAISDESLHDRNPVYAFYDEVCRRVEKHQIHVHGGIHAQIGDVTDGRGPILGVPLRKDFAAFFTSPDIRGFFARIRATPTQEHVYRFSARGAASALIYRPDIATGGGGHLSHTVLVDPIRNPITSRLKAKDRQIRNAKLGLPAVVILCDAHCRALSTQLNGPGTVTVDDVVDLFLSGRHHVERGPWLIQKGESQKSRRINAVVVWSLHEAWNTTARGPDARKVKARVIPTRGGTYHAVHQDLVIEVAGVARYLPSIVSMPANALRTYTRPAFYGGSTMVVGGEHALKVKLSLLTLQRVLAGEIAFDTFVGDHPEVFKQIKRVSDEGAMLSDLRIEYMRDRDDDWIELVFERVAPGHLFDEKKGGSWKAVCQWFIELWRKYF